MREGNTSGVMAADRPYGGFLWFVRQSGLVWIHPIHQLQLLLFALYYFQFFYDTRYLPLPELQKVKKHWCKESLSPCFSSHHQITVSDKAWAVASWQGEWCSAADCLLKFDTNAFINTHIQRKPNNVKNGTSKPYGNQT
jgi:hypothetical protein